MATKIKFYLLLFATVLFNISCLKIAEKKYGLNRHYTYKKQQDYLDQITRENGLNASQLVYLDSASYSNLIFTNYSSFSLTPYLGSYFNDSVSVKKTDFLLDNEACVGRIEQETENILVSNRTDTFARDTLINLARLNFFRLSDDRIIRLFDKDKKATIIMMYVYQFGSYYKNLFKAMEALRLKYEKDVNVYILTMDPIYEQHLK
jgi:hypothetical protein